MSEYRLTLDASEEAELFRRAARENEAPERLVARAVQEAFRPAPEVPTPLDQEDVEPDWVREMSPEMRETHRRIRALDRRRGLSKKPPTDAMFDRGWIYEGED